MGKKNSIASSFIYKFSERILVKGLGLIIGIVLARQLAPDIFGQMAILTIFVNLSLIVVQSGFNTALVQKKEITDTDYSTAFYISMGIAVFFVGLLYVVTPRIAAYYDSTLIVWPLRVYSAALVFGAFNSIQVAKMQREMRFRETFFISVIVTVLSGTLGIVAASIGWGIWALVLYYLSSSLFSCFVTMFFCRWFPELAFSKESARALFSYGWKMLVSSVVSSLYVDIRSLIIGKRYSTEELAYYNRGQQFPEIFANTLDESVQSVMLPVLSQQQDDKSVMRETLRKSVKLSSLIVFPAMVGLCVLAEPIVLLLLTEKWAPSIIFIQLICISEMTVPLLSSNLTALKATGKSDIYMKIEIIRRALMIAVLLISVFCFDSVFAIAVGFLISSFIDVIVISCLAKKVLNYGLFDLLKDIWKTLVSSLLMGVIVYAFSLISMNMIVGLISAVIIGAFTYFAFCKLLKVDVLSYMLDFVKSFLKNGRKEDDR